MRRSFSSSCLGEGTFRRHYLPRVLNRATRDMLTFYQQYDYRWTRTATTHNVWISQFCNMISISHALTVLNGGGQLVLRSQTADGQCVCMAISGQNAVGIWGREGGREGGRERELLKQYLIKRLKRLIDALRLSPLEDSYNLFFRAVDVLIWRELYRKDINHWRRLVELGILMRNQF